MTQDDIIGWVVKALLGFVMFVVTGLTGWVLKRSLADRERLIKLEEGHKALEGKVGKIDKDSLTSDDVRGLLDEAFDKQEKTISLQISQAISEGNSENLEKTITRVLKRVLREHEESLEEDTP